MTRLLLSIMTCALVGCSDPPLTLTRTIDSNAGNWLVQYSPPPEYIPLNQLFEVHTYIFGDDVVSLQVDAGMPSHGHGMMTKAVTVQQEDGSYLTTGMLLHMPGEWEIYFDIDDGEIVERAQDSITLAP